MPLTVPAILVALVVLLTGCAAFLDQRADTREAEWEAQTPPLGQFVTVDGARIHVFDAGRPYPGAPDLVLIHGANGTLRDFTFDLVARLQDDFRVLAVDRPGLGYSDTLGEADSDPRAQARVLRAALLQLGLERPIVLGHSYGGAVAMGWALEFEDDTAGVVLLAGATYPWPGPLGGWYRLNDTPIGRPARALVAALAPQNTVSAVLDEVFQPARVPPGYVEYFGPNLSLRRASQANNTRQVNALLSYVTQMYRSYPSLTLPIELIHGDADTIVGLELHSRRMVQEVASARLTIVENGGHMPQHSNPQMVVDAIHRVRDRAAAR